MGLSAKDEREDPRGCSFLASGREHVYSEDSLFHVKQLWFQETPV